jgi:rubrerythrin
MSLHSDPIIIELKKRINEEIFRESELLINGSVSCFDDYKKHVGIIRGLKLSLKTIEETIKFYEEDKEDSD